MTTFYMTVGLPGVGKSTWTNKFKRMNHNYLTFDFLNKNLPFQENLTIISTDNIIENIAKEYRLTYNDVFDDITYSFAEKMSHKLAKFAFARNDIVIWDQTNLTIKSRAKKLALVPAHYKKICVSFGVPDDLSERLQSRPGKIIPEHVMKNMIRYYQAPTTTEGFDDIIISTDIIEKYA